MIEISKESFEEQLIKYKGKKQELEKLVLAYNGKCSSCKKKLTSGSIRINQEFHSWVYFTCQCGYESALWKVCQAIFYMLTARNNCPNPSHKLISWIKRLPEKYIDPKTGEEIDHDEQWFVPNLNNPSLAITEYNLSNEHFECPTCCINILGKYTTTSQLIGVK